MRIKSGSCSLVFAQPRNGAAHFFVTVDAETLLLGHTGQLHILRVQLLLHNLLECLQNQRFRLSERQRTVVFILQLRLRTLASGSNSLRVVSVERAGRLGVVSNG